MDPQIDPLAQAEEVASQSETATRVLQRAQQELCRLVKSGSPETQRALAIMSLKITVQLLGASAVPEAIKNLEQLLDEGGEADGG